MNDYLLFIKPGARYRLVKAGFSWPAFWLTIFWAAYKRLWLHAALAILALLALTAAEQALTIFQSVLTVQYLLVGQFVINVLFGMYGNYWSKVNLEKCGYQRSTVVRAYSYFEALDKADSALSEGNR
jgi:hypothetical protein